MPELPEVEAARRAVHESCCGRHIIEASVADDRIVIDGVASSALETALVGRTISAARRKGKNLWLELDSRPWPSFQFGMTGAFNIKGKEITKYKRSAVSDKEEWPSKFSKVFLKLDDGLEVSFTDKRRLARVRLLDDPATAPPISDLGPDAFLELPAEATFINSILKKRCPIKALLLDQSFLAGIGNWVADEVLYQARIHPEQMACSLSEAECMELHKTIQEVLKLSVDVDADSELFPKDWIFHYRWNKKPGEVGGQKISFITVGGRTSAIVSALQKCTMRSARKQNGSTQKQVEDAAGTSNGKKKRGRKDQPVEVVEGEDLDARQSKKKSKRTAKQSPLDNQAGSKPAGKGKKPATKSKVLREGKEINDQTGVHQPSKIKPEKEEEAVALPKSVRKKGKAKLSVNEKVQKEAVAIAQKEEEAVALPKSVRKRGKAKQSVNEKVQKEAVAIAQKGKAGNKASTKKVTIKTTKSMEQEKSKVVKEEVSDIPKETRGQKRKRVPK